MVLANIGKPQRTNLCTGHNTSPQTFWLSPNYRSAEGPMHIYSSLFCTGTGFGLSNYQENLSMALTKNQSERGNHISEWSCLPRAEIPSLLSEKDLLRGITRIDRTEVQYLHSFEGIKDNLVLYFIYLFFRKTWPLSISPKFHPPRVQHTRCSYASGQCTVAHQSQGCVPSTSLH